MSILKQIRLNKGVSQQNVAKYLGVTQQAYANYESGKREPDFETLKKLAEYFLVSIDYLLGRSETPKEVKEALKHMDYFPVGDMVKVPIIGSVRAGAGGLAYEAIQGYETIPEDVLRGKEGGCFFLRVVGDSMLPLIREGDLALVHKQSSVDSGSYAVVVVNGDEGVIKKVVYGDTWVELHSENPYYPVRRFDGKDVLLVYIVGRVLRVVRSFE